MFPLRRELLISTNLSLGAMMSANSVSKTFQYGKHTVTLETGLMARQATSAVLVSMDETMVLVTVVVPEGQSSQDFFPLTVHYQTKSYAAGKIPGGYLKREGRPSEQETLTSRLIDRPLRPLFPKHFKNEVQIIATVISLNPEVSPDIPAMIGASAALSISGVPFLGPLGSARVGYDQHGQFLLNPTMTELKTSLLDLVVAGTKEAVLMVESEAKELSEEIMLDAVMYGHTEMQVVIDAILEFKGMVGAQPWILAPAALNTVLVTQVSDYIREKLLNAYLMQDKTARRSKINELLDLTIEKFASVEEGDGLAPLEEVVAVFSDLEKTMIRERILDNLPRIDGRDRYTVRPIHIKTALLPRTHGSALFTRGETQALVVTTLGTGKDAQLVDALEGDRKDSFMLHYNFPPYSVGETGPVGSPKRREIGHGNLAKRAIMPVLPTQEVFPYVTRVVSEITESNGSSSMATVCGTSLALMDAGVPIKAPVAGIAMGLVKEGDRFAVLTDILGDEDHLGDMDFKVAGTSAGVTALQMDIKITGITKEIMQVALKQAKSGRLHILDLMNQAISHARDAISNYAPRIITFAINPEKIRDVIGKGGSTIKALTEETGVTIDITDAGIVSIATANATAAEAAKQRIEQIVAEVEVGGIYLGKVTKIVDFGAFVAVLPGKEGLLHISQISSQRVNNVADWLQEGQEVKVKVLEIDRQGRIRLSMKALSEEPENSTTTDVLE